MNLKRIVKNTNLEERIKSFAKIVPISIEIKWKGIKTILSFSNTEKKPLFNFPIVLNNEKIVELHISEDGYVKNFIIQLINDALSKERQIFEINDQILLLYKEINLLYDLSALKVSKGFSVTNIIDKLLEICAKFFNIQNVSLWLIGEDSLRCTKYTGIRPNKDVFKLGEGFIGEIAVSSTSEMLNAPINDSRWKGDFSPTTSVIALLLKVHFNNSGILYLSRHDGKPWESKDYKLANVFAHQFSQEMEAIPPFMWR